VPTTAPTRPSSPPPPPGGSSHARPASTDQQSAPDRDGAYNVRSVPLGLYLPQAHAAGLASNTLAPLRGAPNHLVGSFSSPGRDKVAWSLEARATAIEVFPKWFEKVKATYCRTPSTSRSSFTLLSCVCPLGTETTKYIAVGRYAAVPRFIDVIVERLSRVLFRCTVRVESGRGGFRRGR